MQFSPTEKRDLLKGWIAISTAFSILLTHELDVTIFLMNLVISAFTVGIAFLLHEMGHKYLAQRYNCWAEFRSFDAMLILALVMSFFGFIFAAPGAVMIHGNLTKQKYGRISAMGPLVNIMLAVFFLVLSFFGLGIFKSITFYGFYINSFIALFNMLPFWEFDGVKILRWNKLVYALMVLISMAFVALTYFIF
ncbi:hypothetical protein J4409_03170 [Candidatus Woesearchaeota archaeon]|nr:hypothetical protein [Candidatus Woesearchaeota archaeon]